MRSPLYTAFARDLRHRQTDAERNLWRELRARQVEGAKFLRQYAIGRYIVDFCCVERRLVVEVDGGQHAQDVLSDQQRDAYLNKQGFRVMRFWDNEVLTNMDGVLHSILEYLQTNSTKHQP